VNGARRTAAIATVALALVQGALAVPLSSDEIARLCSDADGAAHCARLVEEVQLKRLPRLAVREGDVLHVTLYPGGRTSFKDETGPEPGRAYALWDYIDALNAAVIFVARADDAAFIVLQRANGIRAELPAEPRASPDRQRLVTADFCASGCTNEVALWRVTGGGIRKEAAWSPAEPWSDATADWRSADEIAIEFTRARDESTGALVRRVGDPGWTRIAAP
jgi:hypothetical protein